MTDENHFLTQVADDIQLANDIKLGNTDAFKLFFKKYYKILLAYMSTFTCNRDLAEDLTQSSFIVLWEKRNLLDTDKSPKNYLFTIAQNQYKKTYRQLRKKDAFIENLKEKSLKNAVDKNPDYLEEQLDQLRKVIETLPPRCKEILILNKFEGLKYIQIAERLEISVKTVEAQMRIAYQKLRERFKSKAFLLWFFLKN